MRTPVSSTHVPLPPGATPAERLTDVQRRVAAAARIAGRKPAEVTLIAISKTHEAEAILPLIAAGQRVFGENRVQEAAAKWPALRAAHPDITLHHVGQLQSNKAEEAVALFDCVHGLDRLSLVGALAKAMEKAARQIPSFIQVNIGAEPQKGGCAIADLPALIAEARAAEIPLAGLMCVPPAGVEAAPYFALLDKLALDQGLANGLSMAHPGASAPGLSMAHPGAPAPGLSMGMSDDFETAVMLGATHVRVGSALFGARG